MTQVFCVSSSRFIFFFFFSFAFSLACISPLNCKWRLHLESSIHPAHLYGALLGRVLHCDQVWPHSLCTSWTDNTALSSPWLARRSTLLTQQIAIAFSRVSINPTSTQHMQYILFKSNQHLLILFSQSLRLYQLFCAVELNRSAIWCH